ncbi:TetR/AcrR family transcriptional regulator [Nocardia caishijiensis]|uniref:TetR family transcriptional regulator n=1 Tax=Nocardia caishijiensis TaxID=184756 RepID=A0ABQ6YMG8_9NOCA|nr:TetR/AcrR family transcriptional regulator [Nocardia caishijiensis]KAF0846975.1 TetR family transcriptional regulator [Nocardia caishijiensis]
MTFSTRSTDELLDTAVELIAESGLDRLTLTMVAERAGVSRATAYRELGDKKALISAIGRHEIGRMVAAAYGTLDLLAPVADIARSATLFTLGYLRAHAAFGYLRDHEPAWLLTIAIRNDQSEQNLVETVAAFAEPLVAVRGDAALALPPRQAAEVIVRTVLSHVLLPDSSLSDEQVAETAARAITQR